MLQQRRFELVVCLAVWIHCPLGVIERSLEQACAVLAPGGRLRFQLLGDVHPLFVTDALRNLATFLANTNRFEEARPILEE